MAQQAKAEGAKTRDEFADLANSKQIPEQKTATGQNLTRECSLYACYDLFRSANTSQTTTACSIVS